MSAAKKRRDDRGAEGFERYYEALYRQRWEALRTALLAPAESVGFADGLTQPYYLDAASVLVAAALEVEPGDRVLDLCAAPGGKSLVIASDQPRLERLVCNERSSARRARLHRVLDKHLPDELRARTSITGHDAARWALYEPRAYDRILADVPCSSERHVVQSAGALAEWSPSRTKRLAQAAYAIACAGFDALAPEGRLVYSTCALSPLENDGVVEKLLARGGSEIALVEPGQVVARTVARYAHYLPAACTASIPGRPTEHGRHFLPDADAGLGPIYAAVVERMP